MTGQPVSDPTERCVRCGADGVESGKVNVATLLITPSVKFYGDSNGVFGIGDAVQAVACRKCGHIELRFADVEPTAIDSEPLDIRPPHVKARDGAP